MSQYLNGKYSSNPEAIEARLRDFVSSYDRGDDVVERPEAFLNRDSEVVGSVKPKIENFESTDYVPVSYTHLDVYKRQVYVFNASIKFPILSRFL